MTNSAEALRDRLVADLNPVAPLALWRPWLLLAVAMVAAMALIAMELGVRRDLLALQPHPVAVLRSAMLLLLGTLAGASAIASARPQIGSTAGPWRAALLLGLLFPLSAILRAITDPSGAFQAAASPSAIECVKASLSVSLGLATIFTLWLRRGAPASPARSGLLAGLAAGALGGFAYSIRCPYNDLAYIGLWYPMVIAVSALAGRLLIARLIRW